MRTIVIIVITLIIFNFLSPHLYAYPLNNNLLSPVTDPERVRGLCVAFEKISGLAPSVYLSSEIRGGGQNNVRPSSEYFLYKPLL